MTLDTLALRVVCEVDLRGSFSAAAETLGYTQSAVSRQVAAAERAVGSALFVRGARGVVPTESGRVVVRHGIEVLARLEALDRELGGIDAGVAGRVVLGAFPIAGAALVPRALAALRVGHPSLEVELRESSSPTQLRRLRAGRLDVALIAVGADLPVYDLEGLRATTIVESGRLRVAVPTAHRFTDGRTVRVQDLAREVWVVAPGPVDGPQFGAWPTLGDPVLGHRASEWTTRLGLVAAGLGVALVPDLAGPALPSGTALVDVVDPGFTGRSVVALHEPQARAGVAETVDALVVAASAGWS